MKKIICEECKKEYWKITNTHLWTKHQMTMDDYKKKYPNALIEDVEISKQRQVSKENKTYCDYRQKALKFYGAECQRCGNDETENLIVHHIDFNNFGYELGNHTLDNLMILCKSCHSKLHNDLKKSKFTGISKIETASHHMLMGLKEEFGLDLTDPNFKDTPKRIARAYYEIFEGINATEEIENILSTGFPSNYDGMIIAEDIHCFSMCPHHFLPVEYHVNLAYIPSNEVLGISKLSRLVELLAKQPKLQEDFTKDISNFIENYLNPKGVIVQVRGRHFCMVMRGVKQSNCWTLTSSITGDFNNLETRNEFQSLLNKKEYQ